MSEWILMPREAAEQACEALLVMKNDYDQRGAAGYITVYTGVEDNQVNIQLGVHAQKNMARAVVHMVHKGKPTIFLGAGLVGSWPEKLLPVLVGSEVLAHERKLAVAGHCERASIAKEYDLLEEMIDYFLTLQSISKDVVEQNFIGEQLDEFRKAL